MRKIFNFARRNLGAEIVAIIVLLAAFSFVKAVTTISTDVSTGGNLGVTGVTTLSSNLYVNGAGGLFNVASTTAFQIQNGSGTSIFTVDTTGGGVARFNNSATSTDGLQVGANYLGQLSVTQGAATRRGIALQAAASPSANLFELDNSSGAFLSGFTGAGGLLMNIASTTALEIQNGSGTSVFRVVTSGTTGATMNAASTTDTLTVGANSLGQLSVTQGAATRRGIALQAAASPSANLFELDNSSGAFLSGFTGAGGLLMNIASTTALEVQNGSGTSLFRVATAAGITQGVLITGNATSTNNLVATTKLTLNARNPSIRWQPTTAGDKLAINTATTTLASLDIGGTWITKGPQTQNGSPDVAEYILTRRLTVQELGSKNSVEARRLPEAGDVVAIDKVHRETVVLATKAYDKSILGIIADGHSGLTNLADLGSNPNAKPLALAGRVRVKITSENGLVKAGDLVTVSATIPGYAMKATKPGYVIGKALESMQTRQENTIMVFIDNIYAGE